jgi:uncharacterized membrane protein
MIMDWSISLSIVGIFVSILIGLTTFYITDKRSRQRRWYQIKETILMELSKSLSEGNVPKLEIISATIRSILRDSNIGELNSIAIDEILDDLIRKITSDPFLDPERRKKLQDQLLTVKSEQIGEGHEENGTRTKEVQIMSISSSMGSILLGIITSIIAAFFLSYGELFLDLLRSNYQKVGNLVTPIFLAAAITTFGIISIIVILKMQMK